MTSREKFEAWFLSEHEEVENSNELSAKVMKMMAWQSWQSAEISTEQNLTDMAVQLANAESKCRELAAENSAIKVMNDCLSEEMRGYESDGAFEGPKMHLLWWKAETPATDAFLAEVRAQGVEIYADNLDSSADDAERDGFDDAVKFLRSEASGVRLFAAQLRKGVRS